MVDRFRRRDSNTLDIVLFSEINPWLVGYLTYFSGFGIIIVASDFRSSGKYYNHTHPLMMCVSWVMTFSHCISAHCWLWHLILEQLFFKQFLGQWIEGKFGSECISIIIDFKVICIFINGISFRGKVVNLEVGRC